MTAPARRPCRIAQASTGPATHVAVTGITPCRMACGYCKPAVLSSSPAVIARSALSSDRVRPCGRAYAVVVTAVQAAITAIAAQAQSGRE